jgi:hypothetical protein
VSGKILSSDVATSIRYPGEPAGSGMSLGFGAVSAGAEIIVTTEKDAVRFPLIERCDLPILYLRVEIEMLSGSEAFNDWIDRICFK